MTSTTNSDEKRAMREEYTCYTNSIDPLASDSQNEEEPARKSDVNSLADLVDGEGYDVEIVSAVLDS
jgi:hypothetical protein